MRQDGLAAPGGAHPWRERVLGVPGRARPGVAIALAALLLSLEFAAWALFSPAGPTHQQVDRALALALLLLAVVALLLPRTRVPHWPAGVLAALTALLLVGVATRLTAQGQVVLGVDIVLVAVVAAYLLPRRSYLVLLVATVVASLAIMVGGELAAPFYPVMLSVITVTISLLVADLVLLLEDAALVDPLTGALNRRGLASTAPVVHAVSARAGAGTSVVVVDVDRFKAYNDERGHAAGDAVLVGLVTHWRSQLREGDLLARTGGDEFVVMLPGSADRDVDAVMERLRQAGPVPWSYGAAVWVDDEPLDRVIARADAALMADKTRRRGSRSAD